MQLLSFPFSGKHCAHNHIHNQIGGCTDVQADACYYLINRSLTPLQTRCRLTRPAKRERERERERETDRETDNKQRWCGDEGPGDGGGNYGSLIQKPGMMDIQIWCPVVPDRPRFSPAPPNLHDQRCNNYATILSFTWCLLSFFILAFSIHFHIIITIINFTRNETRRIVINDYVQQYLSISLLVT